jgi:hypothetical protein
MADPALSFGQYSIGKDLLGGDSAALVYGRGFNSLQVINTAIQSGAIASQDQALIGADGMQFGIDAQDGMVITQTGLALTTPATGVAAMDAYSTLAGKWNDPSVRLTDNSLQVLRASYPFSSVVRRAFGRGRQIQPALGQVFTGQVPWTAQFQAADNNWYHDVEQSVVVSIPPSFRGGFIFPATPPYFWGVSHTATGNLPIGGVVPTWPRIHITGPVASPLITFLGSGLTIGYSGSIPSGQSLIIDTRPWNRTSLLQGASAADKMAGTSLVHLKLQPGFQQFQYTGVDFTGTSFCTIFWRNAWLLPGGSS